MKDGELIIDDFLAPLREIAEQIDEAPDENP